MIVTCRLQSRLKLQLQKKKKNEIACNWILPRRVFILTIKRGAHHKQAKKQAKNKQKKCSGVKNNEKS